MESNSFVKTLPTEVSALNFEASQLASSHLDTGVPSCKVPGGMQDVVLLSLMVGHRVPGHALLAQDLLELGLYAEDEFGAEFLVDALEPVEEVLDGEEGQSKLNEPRRTVPATKVASHMRGCVGGECEREA